MDHATPHRGAEVDPQVEFRHPIQASGRHQHAKDDQPTRLHLSHETAYQRHAEQDRQAARREHHAAQHRGVSQQRLEEQRQQRGAAVEHKSEDQHGRRGQREIALLENAKIDDRVFLPKFPQDHANQADRADHGESDDVIGGEPVFLLTLVEDHFERSETQRQESEADSIDAQALFEGAADEIGWVLDQGGRE